MSIGHNTNTIPTLELTGNLFTYHPKAARSKTIDDEVESRAQHWAWLKKVATHDAYTYTLHSLTSVSLYE